MMKLEDMEDADPRYATTVEVADLRRTLDDFMKKQQQRNEAIKTKLDKIMYSMEKLGVQDDGRIEDQASKVKAKDLHDTPECQMQDPFYEEGMEKADWEDCPWSASELEAFYENAYQEWPLEPIKPPPVVTSYTPTSSTTNTFTAAPAKCSTDCSSQDKNAFPPRTVVLRKEEELHKESSTLIQAHVVLDDMHQRYIINFTYPNSINVVLPYLATRVCDAERVFEKKSEQYSVVLWPPFTSALDWMLLKPSWPPPIQNRWEEIIFLNPVLLEPFPAIFTDKEPEQLNISHKPPWSVPCLEAESTQCSFISQSCLGILLWFSYGWVTGQPRSPWPPPTQPQFQGVGSQLKPPPWPFFTINLVVVYNPASPQSRVKPLFAMGNVSGYYSVAWKLGLQINFAVSMLLGNHAHISLLFAIPVRNQYWYGLVFLVATGQNLFQNFDLHTTEVHLKNLLSVMPISELWCCHKKVHCQVILPFQNYIYIHGAIQGHTSMTGSSPQMCLSYCYVVVVKWATPWLISTSLNWKDVELNLVTVTHKRLLSSLYQPLLMGNKMMFLAYDTVEVHALECNHMKTEVNLLKFCQAAVLYEFMASNWIVENMHYSVICSLVPQVRATFVLSIISEHVFIMCYHNGVAVRGSLILLVLHYSLAYNDELAMARSSKYYVQKFLKCHKEFAADEKSNQRNGLQYLQMQVQMQQQQSYWLLTRIIDAEQMIPSHPGGDKFFLEGFESQDDSGKLKVHRITIYFCKKIKWPASVLSSLKWLSSFSGHRALLLEYKLWFFTQLWKPPWMSSIYKFLQEWCTAALNICKYELSTDEKLGQTKVLQHLQISVVIRSTTITNQRLIWWDLVGTPDIDSSTRAGWKHCKLLKSAVQIYLINMKTICSVAGINSSWYCTPDRITLLLMVTCQVNYVQLRPTPWPSFDFLTSVHLEKALLDSWHSLQIVKLPPDDGRLLHIATESFLLVSVASIGSIWYYIPNRITLLFVADENSDQRNGVQHLHILVKLQQHLNYQPVIICDPGEGQYFIGGCKSLDYWSNMEVRQSVVYLVKQNQGLYLLDTALVQSWKTLHCSTCVQMLGWATTALNIPLCNSLAWAGGGVQQEQHDNRTKICCYILKCYAFMRKLILSRTNSSQCGTLLHRVVAEIAGFPLLLVTELIQKFSHLSIFAFADQVTGISCAMVPCSQVQFISLLVNVIRVLVRYTGNAVLHSFMELHSSVHCEWHTTVEDFLSSASCGNKEAIMCVNYPQELYCINMIITKVQLSSTINFMKPRILPLATKSYEMGTNATREPCYRLCSLVSTPSSGSPSSWLCSTTDMSAGVLSQSY